MKTSDALGHVLSGASAQDALDFEHVQHELRCYIGDPLASVERLLQRSPDMVMAHVLKAYVHLLGTEPAGLPVARACHRTALALQANERERAHLKVIRLLNHGRWREAGRTLEDLSVEFPRDALALQVGHQVDFFTGDARMLRDRIARALPAWHTGMPGYHALLGMYAFGLEEMGDYAQAEAQGRYCVELQPRDAWGRHAVTHVMEMCRRPRDGIRWMRESAPAWSRDSFLAVPQHLAPGAVPPGAGGHRRGAGAV